MLTRLHKEMKPRLRLGVQSGARVQVTAMNNRLFEQTLLDRMTTEADTISMGWCGVCRP